MKTLEKQLPAFSWPGLYPMFYVATDRENFRHVVMCADCANKWEQPEQLESLINWELTFLQCDECGEEIPAAYESEE